MNALTLTETKLYNLSDPMFDLPDYDKDYEPGYRDLPNYYAILNSEGEHYRKCFYRLVAMIWNEAHIQNDHITAQLLNEAYSVTAPVVLSREAQAHALAVMHAREERTLTLLASAEEELVRLRAKLSDLRSPIVDGSDERLGEFWEKAGEAANEAGFCPEYDRIAELLGGPGRTITYDVELRVTHTSTVTVTVPRGTDLDRYVLRANVDLDDIVNGEQSDIDWDDVEVTDYSEADGY